MATDETALSVVRAVQESGGLRQTAEHSVNVLKALVSAIPIIGSPLSSLMGDYIPKVKEERLRTAVDELAKHVDCIKDRIDPARILTSEYAFVFEQSVRGIVNHASKEKRDAFRAILLNALTQADVPFPEQEYYLNLLETLSATHIKVLALMYEPSRYLASHTPTWKKHPATYLDYISGAVGLPPEIVKSAMEDLHVRGMFNHDLGFLHTGIDDQKVHPHLQGALSPHAKRFIRFCTGP